MRHVWTKTLNILVVGFSVVSAVHVTLPGSAQTSRPPAPEEVREASDAHRLSEDGPQLPRKFSTSDLTFKAFVKGGWPLFISYELVRPGVVTLDIRHANFPDCPTLSHTFGGSRAGPYQEKFSLPEGLASRPFVAIYSIKATSDGTPRGRPVPLHLYAIGAGPRAVNSSGFDLVNFQPGQVVARQREQASYSFRAIRDFTRARADFMRRSSRGPDSVFVEFVGSQEHRDGARPGETISGVWDCKSRGEVSVGLHELWVFGWRPPSEGDWMVTCSDPQMVDVR